VVDCQALASGEWVGNLAALEAQRQADESLDHDTPIEELFEDQLGCADLVLLTKVDQVSDSERAQVERWLRQELPTGIQVIPCQRGQIAAEVLLGLSAGVEDRLDQRPSHHDHEEDHDHEAFDSLHLTLPPVLEPGALIAQLRQLLEKECLYRVKGFVAVTQKPMRMVLQGVGSRLETYYDRPWRTDELRQTRLVLIGQHLDRERIQVQLQPLPMG
jgi:cobalamin biosynthesis protein CobW